MRSGTSTLSPLSATVARQPGEVIDGVLPVESTMNAPEPGPPAGRPRRLPIVDLLREIWQGCWDRREWTAAATTRLIVVFCFVAVMSWLGIRLSRQSEGVATIWLSNGLIFGLLITQPPRRWLPYFVAGLTADTMADVFYGDPFRVAAGVSLANAVEVFTSAIALTRLFGAPLDLSKRRPLVGFLAVSVLAATALTSALGASWTLLFYDAGPWWKMFRTWWLGDMLGMAILAPLTVILQRPDSSSILGWRQLPRSLLILAAPIFVTVLIFTHNTDPLIFFLFPALLLVAFRLGFRGTVLAIVLVTLLAIGLTVKGHGPLMLIAGEHMMLHRIIVAQIFAGTAIFTMFPVAALLEEKDALKASLAESEARHRILAQTDELTALANRRAFNLRLETAWAQASQGKTPIGLLLIDADHFKQYNDVFGHTEGDECLRQLAALIASALRGRDALPARYGGEEFAVLLPGADADAARAAAELVCFTVSAERLPHPTGPGGIQTVSVGAATLVPTDGQPSTVLVKRADEALYCAKLAGRNQTALLL